jgi:hypothetical protein
MGILVTKVVSTKGGNGELLLSGFVSLGLVGLCYF